MLKKISLLFMLLGIALKTAVFPQTPPNTKQAVKFTSVYTDLAKDCRSALSEKEEKEASARGQDIPQRCKGFGGYAVYIYYSAVEQYLGLKNGEAYEDHISLRPKDSPMIEQFGRRIEWRLANNRPFAVIVRYEHYKSDEFSDEEGPFNRKNKKGESLVIKGLKSFEQIYFQINAKTPKANQKARELADTAWKENFRHQNPPK